MNTKSESRGKLAVEMARQYEAEVKAAARRQGLLLTVNRLASGVDHLLFDRIADGQRVLDHWPSTGRWRCHANGEVGRAWTWWEALVIAARMAERMKNEGVAS